MKEFNLSEKKHKVDDLYEDELEFAYLEEDVKEAVKELKSQVKKYIVGTGTCCKMIAQINEIFGDKLI